ncbi:FAM96B protein [Rhizopogon vinicolor AM-OR11-026]|uniref:FAM96B protein n=1 Tax=Rhizopogon vinicolor AM-OR11-026 TaxID=1314800 RepID=A0A1B7NAH4_9AGAM|nr:FAM96B protein [Rhizopogon vinicolor AM-OR11-026]
MTGEIFNANPTVYALSKRSTRKSKFEAGRSLWVDEHDQPKLTDESDIEPIDQDEIFDLIRSIADPEHPNSLEELRVVSAEQIEIGHNHILVEFTPTVPHCGMSTLIGLSIRVRLMRSLPQRFKVDIRVKPGSHQSELAVNKQLNDKERVAAALENATLVGTLEKCLEPVGEHGSL